MIGTIAAIIGGVGLFLLGMILMTDGLKALAGDALRSILARYTRNRLSAAAAGAGVTLLVQSSSATTIATVGFVSAGLLSFQNAIGVIIGAAVGTTGTGWLVALLGLKLSFGKIMLPFIGVGAMAKLLGKGRVANLGMAIAGFGVIFVGIDVLQDGMAGLSEFFDPEDFPAPTLLGRALLVGIGILMTVIMQSSSAAVATTLAALAGGTINIDQAAALVVGQNVGTAVSSSMAAIGASIPARRTAAAHVIFNLSAGTIGFLVLPLFTHSLERWGGEVVANNHAITIAAFHTAFNVVGAAVFLPLTPRLARLAERIIKAKGPRLTQHLDNSLLRVPTVAVQTVRNALKETAATLFVTIRDGLKGERRFFDKAAVGEVEAALAELRHFMAKIPPPEGTGYEFSRQISTMHAIDHLERLVGDSRDPAEYAASRRFAPLRSVMDEMVPLLDELVVALRDPEIEPNVRRAEVFSARLADERRSARPQILEATAARRLDPDAALAELRTQRWLDRLAYHVWRASHHLREMTRKEMQENPEHTGAGDTGMLPRVDIPPEEAADRPTED